MNAHDTETCRAARALAARRPLRRARSPRCAAHFSEFGADPRAACASRSPGSSRWPTSPAIAEVAAVLRRRRARRSTAVAASFAPADAARVKAIERTTNHDVKAVEYWLKERFAGDAGGRARVAEFIHFACTSEDINNLAHGLMLAEARRDVLLPALREHRRRRCARSRTRTPALPMLARTHGQPATPTTLGKEIANVVARLERADRGDRARAAARARSTARSATTTRTSSPIRTSTGSALAARRRRRRSASSSIRTRRRSSRTTAWPSCSTRSRAPTPILIDLDRDVWGYVSLGYFRQRMKEGEVGSSTMPHKVNPIDFENSEGNLGLANALLRHLAEKLPISRWQRDLTDSTVLRNMGVALGYALLGWVSLRQGLAQARGRRGAHRRRPRRQLGSARRADPDGDAPLRRRRIPTSS